MRISIFGIGYVGVTSAAYFANRGDQVTLVDTNPKKIHLINNGKSPIANQQLKKLVEKNWKSGRISATQDSEKAVHSSDVSMICVGTPASGNGEVDLSHVFSVFSSIGKALKNRKGYHLTILRSTSPPGTARQGLRMVEKHSGKRLGADFGGCMCPEFLRGWSLVEDFYNPPFSLIGQLDKKSGDLAELLYKGLDAEVIRTELETAEMVKYVCNSFHALKTAFANEVGRICKKNSVDAREVMDIFARDTKLSISADYLKPGFAFGGSCLPKDVRALTMLGEQVGAKPFLLESIMKSNDAHIDCLVEKIEDLKVEHVGVVGVTYQKGTDDLRYSQIVELTKRLIKRGINVRICDDLDFNNLIGANKEYVESLPFTLQTLCVSIDELVNFSDVVIFAHALPKLKESITKLCQNKLCIDFGDFYQSKQTFQHYDGICW